MKQKASESLSPLTDDDLLLRLSNIVKQSRRVESVLVAHIAEVDARRLYAREAMPSMHKYCTEVLRLSDAAAYSRITVARASRRYPVLLAMLEDGRLHLSGLAELAPHLTPENCDALLAQATHQSKRAIRELVAELAPKPDVAPSIRKLPEPRSRAQEQPTLQQNVPAPSPDERSVCRTTTPAGRSHPEPTHRERDPRARIVPLSKAKFKVQFTASAEFHDKLGRLASFMPGNDLASMLEAAVTKELERIEAKRFGKTKKPRQSAEDADNSPGGRYISAAVRRLVGDRDEGRCTFVGKNGQRCPARDRVEYHHDEPYARGGDRSAENIRLACRAHNMYMAENDYGKEKISRYRRSADCAREPTPRFVVLPTQIRREARNHGSRHPGWPHASCARRPQTLR